MADLTYITLMAKFGWLAILLLWFLFFKQLKKYKIEILKSFVIVFPVVMVWDAISIFFKSWAYGTDKILGIYVLWVPIEEIIFVATISFGISTFTSLLYDFFKKK